MKKVFLCWEKGWETKDIVVAMVSQPQDGARYDEVMKRMRLIDVFDEVKPTDMDVYLEDADWEQLKTIAQNFRFNVVGKHLRTTLQNIMEAKDGRRPAEQQRVSERPDGVPVGGVSDDRSERGGSDVDARRPEQPKLDPRSAQNGQLDARGAEGEYVER